ncbi:MAG: DJ-1/PfpI family protein [Patescibacteria group bacterium]|jgi:protease I
MIKKAVFIIAQHDFRDEELLVTKEVLDKRKIETKVASKTRHKALGKLGTEIKPDLAMPEIEVADFDAIIFVGGRGARDYLFDDDALKLVKDFKGQGKILGGICIGPSILANAGVLIGRTVTAFPTEEENIRNKGADYTGMPVEVDGNIVTAKDPTAAKEFGEKLAYLLED